MNKKFDRSLLAGYGISILLLIALGLVGWLTLNRLQASDSAVDHSDLVIKDLEQVLSHMKDAETGQRGFLLTGRENFLQPYRGATRQALALTDTLSGITRDNPVQQRNIIAIREVIRQRLNILEELIAGYRNGNRLTESDLDKGKAAMDRLRQLVTQTEREEQLLLQSRSEQLGRYNHLAPVFLGGAILLALLLTLSSYFKVIADIRQKDRLYQELADEKEEIAVLNEELAAANEEINAANEELTASNEELSEARDELAAANRSLEQRVADRTHALQESEEETQALNEELTAINEELSATNEELTAANAELREAHEQSAKLAAIVESSDDAIIGKDLNGIVTSWNRGAEQLFGYPANDIVGLPILTIIPDDLQHEEPGILARLRSGEKIDHYETLRQTADGRLLNVSLTISPIRDREGKVSGVSKIARDITVQKRDDQRKSDFIGMASHELKTPLTSLIAIVQVLQLRSKDHADRFIPAALDKVAVQARKMTSLINGFLNVSRLESGRLVIEKRAFDLTDLIREQIADSRLTASQHTLVFEPLSEIRVVADPDKIGSVISNLLSNAVKYSPKGGAVTVRAERHGEAVWVSVQDEGIGIRPQDKDKLFDRYYRVESEHTRHISGFGVGLYLSAEIIQGHHGHIWVESEQGAGSTFYFSLPLNGMVSN